MTAASATVREVMPGWREDEPPVHDKLDRDLLVRAYRFSEEAHRGQRRNSGEPYITHSVEVAKILAELQLDSVTVAAGLLHDVVEDTKLTIADVQKEFGRPIADIVDGLTKIAKLPTGGSTQERQVESYRKLLLSIAKDARVIIVKLADRLHNMRTLEYLPPEKRVRIAQETRDLYAPLAHRFGMAKLRWELEDLSFKHIETDEYKALAKKVAQKRGEREALIKQMAEPLIARLTQSGIKDVEVTGRPKHLWSIYKKMKQREKPYEEIYDLLAIRVLVNSVPDCYHALGVIHDGWTPVQERIKDYIAQPKSNGYQSLHTTVFGPGQTALRSPDPHARHAPHGGLRHRGALALQGGREERRARSAPLVVPAGARAPDGRQDAGRIPRVPQARLVSGRDLRLHADGRRHPAAEGRDAARLRVRGAHGDRAALRRREGERPHRAALTAAAQLGDGRDHHVEHRAPDARLARARSHRPRAPQDPPGPQARSAVVGREARPGHARSRGQAPSPARAPTTIRCSPRRERSVSPTRRICWRRSARATSTSRWRSSISIPTSHEAEPPKPSVFERFVDRVRGHEGRSHPGPGRPHGALRAVLPARARRSRSSAT